MQAENISTTSNNKLKKTMEIELRFHERIKFEWLNKFNNWPLAPPSPFFIPFCQWFPFYHIVIILWIFYQLFTVQIDLSLCFSLSNVQYASYLCSVCSPHTSEHQNVTYQTPPNGSKISLNFSIRCYKNNELFQNEYGARLSRTTHRETVWTISGFVSENVLLTLFLSREKKKFKKLYEVAWLIGPKTDVND